MSENWILVAMSLSGSWLLSCRRPMEANFVWAIANAWWVFVFGSQERWPEMVLFSAHLGFSIRCLWTWKGAELRRKTG